MDKKMMSIQTFIATRIVIPAAVIIILIIAALYLIFRN